MSTLRDALGCALLAMFALASSARASTGTWGIHFVASPTTIVGTRQAYVLRGATYNIELHSRQCGYQTADEIGGDGDDDCPALVTLAFEETPPGVTACFPTSARTCVAGTALSPGSSVPLRITVSPGAPVQATTLRVRASNATETKYASLLVRVVPELFEPPQGIVLFRGDAATNAFVPFDRPTGLPYDIDVFAGGAGTLFSTSFSPATLSGGADGATLSIAAFNTTPTGTRGLSVSGMVQEPLVEPTVLAHPFTVQVVEAFSPSFPANTEIAPGMGVQLVVAANRHPSFTRDVSFTLTGCNCEPMSAFAAIGSLPNATHVTVQTSAATPAGTINVGVRAKSGSIVRDFIVPVRVVAP